MTGESVARRSRPVLRRILIYVVGTAVAVLFLLPLLWLFSTSLKTRQAIASEVTVNLVPERPWQWRNYAIAWSKMPFGLYLRNSLFVVVVSVAGTLLTGSMVAYGFGRLRFLGRNLLFGLLLATMMLPRQVTVIPTYLMFHKLGWVNTYMPLTIGSWAGGGAFYVFLMRQFMSTIPLELDDAARVDGASRIDIYWRIILPNMGPALATAAIFRFVSSWNNLFHALIYLTDSKLWTMPVAMVLFKDDFANPQQDVAYLEWHIEWLAAMGVVTMLPVLVVYLSFQRYFVRGVALTGIKG